MWIFPILHARGWLCVYHAVGGFVCDQAIEDTEELHRKAMAREDQKREMELKEERARRDKIAKAESRRREEDRIRKSEAYRLQVRTAKTRASAREEPKATYCTHEVYIRPLNI